MEAIFDQIECRFLQNRLASYVGRRKKKKSGPKIHFWVAGEAFFSDLGHFSGFGDFSRFGDFGCLKHITKAQHLLSSHSGNEGKADAVFITKTCKW